LIFIQHNLRKLAVMGAAGLMLSGLSACQTVSIDRGDFGDFKRSLNTTDYGYQQVADPTGSAPVDIVERFEVRPGDCFGNDEWSDCEKDRERSELSERGVSTVGSTYWYGWDIYLPADYPNIYPTKTALGQFHQENGLAPSWMFQNGEGGYHLDGQVGGKTRYYYTLITDEDLRGKWHRIELQVKWARDTTGFFRVWVDGDQKVNFSGATLESDTTYLKYGVYRSFMSRYRTAKNVDDVPGQVALYANVKRANSRAGLAPN
jgi:hypothetical protein